MGGRRRQRRPRAGEVALSAIGKAQLGARAALAKKAEGVVLLDLAGISTVTDCFLICSGASAPQVRTIADAIEEALAREGYPVGHREGVPESGWVLLDYGEVVVHVFLPDTREYYALERLWGDAPALPVEA